MTYLWSLFGRLLVAAVICLALALSAVAESPAVPTIKKGGTHKLIVAVKKTMAPAAEKKLAVLVLISQNGGAPAAALSTPVRPLTVLQQNGGLYRVKAEIDSTCNGRCDAPGYRISGSTDHRLEVVPSCKPTSRGFLCSKVEIVKLY